MPRKTGQRFKICMVSSAPVTLWSFYRGLPGRLKDEGIDLEICSSPGKELDYFEKQYAITVHQVNILRQITPWRDMLAILKLVKIFKRNRYKLVHAHTPKAGLLGMIAATVAGVRCRIYTCHGLVLETEVGLKRHLLACAERISCALAHRVLSVSHSLVDKLEAYKICPKSKLMVLGDGTACGVELNRFTLNSDLIEKGKVIRRRHNIPDDATVIGFIGRLVPDKGVHILVESFTQLYELNPNTRLLVLGDFEPHRGRLPGQTLKVMNNHSGIIHVGFTHEIEPYYVAMDVLVLPTRREGFPYAPLEAAALELPTVVTKVTGCVDAVVDNITGLLVEVGNVEQLLGAMLRLVKDPELRRQLGKQGRQRVEALFDSRLLIDKHINLYEELIDKNVGC